MTQIYLMKCLYFYFFLACVYSVTAQNPKSFYLKINQFEYPTNPLPKGISEYAVVTNLWQTALFMRDYKGDIKTLDKIREYPLGYNPGAYLRNPKLYTFLMKPKNTIDNKSGFVLELKVEDVELFYQKGEERNTYDLQYKYAFDVLIHCRERIHAQKHYEYGGKAITFTSSLSAKDVPIMAIEVAKKQIWKINDEVLKNTLVTFNYFSKGEVDMAFNPQFIQFYGLSKSKKLDEGVAVKSLEDKIRALEFIDGPEVDRNQFVKALQVLEQELIGLRESADYQELSSFKYFVHANLSRIYQLMEQFDLSGVEIELALHVADKERFKNWMLEERRKLKIKQMRYSNMYTDKDILLPSLSAQYALKKESRLKSNN